MVAHYRLDRAAWPAGPAVLVELASGFRVKRTFGRQRWLQYARTVDSAH